MLKLEEKHLYKVEEIAQNMFHKIKKFKKLQFENELFLLKKLVEMLIKFTQGKLIKNYLIDIMVMIVSIVNFT